MKEGNGLKLDYGLLSRCRGELMGLAMLWVMMFHAFCWAPRWSWVAVVKSYGYCGVDVFLLLSGLGLAMSLGRREQSYGAYLKKRLVRVVPLYWLVVGSYGLALRLGGETSLKTVAWTLSGLSYWLNKPGIFNWYIPALLGFYLIAPGLVWLIKRAKHPQLLVILSWFAMYFGYEVTKDFWGEVPGGTLARLPIFLCGCMIGVFLTQERKLTWKAGIVWFFLPLLMPVVRKFPYYVPNGLWFMLGCVPLCLVVAWGMERLGKGGARRVLRRIGDASLEIYLLNVIFVLQRPLLERVFLVRGSYPIFYAITIALNLLLGIGLHALGKRPLEALARRVGSKS